MVAKLATLTNPASLTDGTNSFTSSSGVDLTASTRYFVMVDLSSAGGNWRIRSTNSDNEDSGAASGFSIGNRGTFRPRAHTNIALSHFPDSRKIAILGKVKQPSSLVRGDRLEAAHRREQRRHEGDLRGGPEDRGGRDLERRRCLGHLGDGRRGSGFSWGSGAAQGQLNW